MIAIIVVSATISGILAAFSAWILGYGPAVIVLAYWLTGTLAFILTTLLQVIFGFIARWWWARTVEFRFRIILFQAAGVAVAGTSILGFAIAGMLHPLATVPGLLLLMSAPAWLTLIMDSTLGEPEHRQFEDYL